MNCQGILYRWIMKIAHRFNWHYAPPIYPEGDTLLWCKWCGLRQVVKRRDDKPAIKTVSDLVAERVKALKP